MDDGGLYALDVDLVEGVDGNEGSAVFIHGSNWLGNIKVLLYMGSTIELRWLHTRRRAVIECRGSPLA